MSYDLESIMVFFSYEVRLAAECVSVGLAL